MSSNSTLSQFRKAGLSCFHVFGFIFLLTLIFTFHTTTIYSAQVTLAWDPNNESDLAGYKIYYGNSSGDYDTNIDVGNQTSYTISGLVDGNAYYFVATAYDTSGNESGYSEEEFYNAPVIPSLWPVKGAMSGQSCKLWAKFKNTSSSALPSDAKVRFWVNGPGWSGSHWVGETSVAGLRAGGTIWCSYDWDVPSDAPAGTYKYLAQVWTTSKAVSPWSASMDFSVIDSSGIRVVSLWPVTGATGQSSRFWAQANNNDSSSLPSDAKVRFWVTGPSWSGSHWVGEASVAGLKAGKPKWCSYDWNIPSDAPVGTYAYWAQVRTTSKAISPWSAGEYISVTGGKAQVVYLGPVTGALSGQSSSFWVDVENTSSSALPSDAKVRFWVTGPGWSGSHWVGETSVAGLAAGGTQSYSYDWLIPSDAQAGTYRYWAQVWTTSEAVSTWSTREDFSVQ